MADSEIQILIRAVDEVTATMKNIEKKLDSSNKNMQAQTKATTQTFDKQMGSLILLGQTAGTVDNIFDSYQNMQLRVENATERVASAQDRLRETQYKLSKTQKDVTATAEDVANAEQDVESASRGLNIAQNRLAITNNQVIGTYISIGMQTVSLIRSFPLLIMEVRALTAASMAFIATPIGIAMVALGVAVGGTAIAMGAYNKAAEEVVRLEGEMAGTKSKIISLTNELNDSFKSMTESAQVASDVMSGIITKKSVEELQNDRDIKSLELQLLNYKLSEDERLTLESQLKVARYRDEQFTAQRDLGNAQIALLTAQKQQEIGIVDSVNLYQKLNYKDLVTYITDEYTIQYNLASQARQDRITAETNAAIADLDRLNAAYGRAVTKKEAISNLVNSPVNKALGLPANVSPFSLLTGKSKNVGDAIIRPNGDVINTDPRDTLIATKNPGGMNGGIVISIENIYGIDAAEIATALDEMLRNKIIT